MSFPWEQAIKTGIQLGAQQAAAARASGAQKQAIEDQFNALNDQVAAYLRRLSAQPYVTAEQFNQGAQAFGQLEGFANEYSFVDYVREQWQDEQPRYKSWFEWLLANKTSVAVTATTATAAASNSNPQQPLAAAVVSAPGAVNPANNNYLLLIAALAIAVLLLKR